MSFFKFGALLQQLTTTASSGGTLTLSNTSKTYQRITGTSTETVTLPDATTCENGLHFTVINESTGSVTVNYFGGSLAKTLTTGQSCNFVVSDATTSTGFSIDPGVSSGGGGGTVGSLTTFTMTIGGSGSAPTKGTTSVDNATYMLIGKLLFIRYDLNQSTGGSAGTGTYLFPLPAGFTINTTFLTPSTSGLQPVVGYGTVSNASSLNAQNVYPSQVIAYNSTNLSLSIYQSAGTPQEYLALGSGSINLSQSGIVYSFNAWVPVN